ncbi:MAG: hypothetical protein HYU58_04905 [Proteobacteria bacterium]|nr:hypothetical protein [Pseudomonadota bacterium]
MKIFARIVLIAVVAVIVLAALVFVWGMQRTIDVSTPEARAQQMEAMVLGCKVRMPEVLKKAQTTTALQPAQMDQACTCAVNRVIDTYSVDGKLKPSDVSEEQSDAAELACIKELTAQ